MSINTNLLNLTAYKSKLIPTEANSPDVNENFAEAESANNVQAVSDVTDVQFSQSSVKSAVYTDIKAAIFNYSHPEVSGITTSYGTNFDDICATLNISPTSKLTKSALTKLTQNDSLEDENKDFCGALNRAFAFLKPTDTISYNDVMVFFMRATDKSSYSNNDYVLNFSEYYDMVETYSNEVENQYEALSTDQKKLEFIIEKTRDYLTESNMQLQLGALDRLTSEPCASQNNYTKFSQTGHVGQIAFGTDFDPPASDGSFNAGLYCPTMALPLTHTKNGKTYEASLWAADTDYAFDGDIDGGITLNATQLVHGAYPYKWYELVEVLVHELTHATAYFYYNVNVDNEGSGTISYSQAGLQFMIDKGIISAGQYNKNDVYNSELGYLVNTMWGEYAAYITSTNYYDSIAGDIFDTGAVIANGSSEKSKIYNHINKYYNTGDVYEAEPEASKWDIYNTMFYA